MNKTELSTISDKIREVAESIGFTITELSPSPKGFHFHFCRATGPTIWEEVSPKHISGRGRLDFTVCHTRCKEIEHEEKRKIKHALRRAIPEISNAEIVGHYADHYDKIIACGNGFAHNLPQ